MTNTPAGADNATAQNDQPDRPADGGGDTSVRGVVGRAIGGGPSSNAVVPLRTGGRVAGIVPTSIEEVFRLATAISKSGMAPRDMGTPEKLTVAILHGLEIGIPPMMAINKIAVVNGRPTLWGDAIPAILLSRGFAIRESFYGEGDDRFAQCIVVRPNGEQITRNFSVVDAKIAGLWAKPGPWKQYPDRMLQMRARGLAARDGAADALSGLYLEHEMQDVPPESSDLLPAPPMSTRRKSSSQAKKDGDDVAFNELRGAISGADTIEDLDGVIQRNSDFLDTLPHGWARITQAEIDDKRQELNASAAE